MLAVHSGGYGATAWQMSMARNAPGFDDSKKDVTKEGVSAPSQEEGGSAALPPKEEATNGNVDKTSDKDSSSKKRVSFGEPPQEAKTDEMTPERLEELKKELQEAEKMEQKALEVRQQVFGSRIVSRTDVGDLGRDVKSLERVFPCGGTMAVIVDDREDVWANAQDSSKIKGEPPENLLFIRPYHWKPFLGFADVNNAAGEDISGESTTTEDEDDEALLWTLDCLKRTHKRFYNAINETGNSDITVPPLLRQMRQEVLQGCTLVFSGLIRLDQQNRASRFPRPNVVRYGESLGARVSRLYIVVVVVWLSMVISTVFCLILFIVSIY
jgi:RNA polymerase II subunit A-like phosphatase